MGMAEEEPRLGEDARPLDNGFKSGPQRRVRDSSRDWKLIEAVGVAIGCHTLAESLRELAPRILELTDCEFLKLSQYDPNQDCMITHFWSRDRVRGKCDAFAVD